MTYKIGEERFNDIASARKVAAERNKSAPEVEVSVMKDGKLKEIWVGPATLTPVNDNFIVYTDADIDTIASIQKNGAVFTVFNRQNYVGVFGSLFEAAHAAHEHAKSNLYVAA